MLVGGGMRRGCDDLDDHYHYHYYYDFFFFSSRRRHTRLVSDWSSDVCSSDLNRKPLEPSVPIQENIGTNNF